MAEAAEAVLPPVAPERASLVGRFLMGVISAGAAGTVGAGIGLLVGGIPGVAIGMTIGVVGAAVYTGKYFGIKDVAKRGEYQAQRQEFKNATGEDWPDEQQRPLRKAKIVAGAAGATALMAFAIGLPAVTAAASLVAFNGLLVGAYLWTRGKYRSSGGKYRSSGGEYRSPEGTESESAEVPAPSQANTMWGNPAGAPAGAGTWGRYNGQLNWPPRFPGPFGVSQPQPAH